MKDRGYFLPYMRFDSLRMAVDRVFLVYVVASFYFSVIIGLSHSSSL